jgi:hypothetical protein
MQLKAITLLSTLFLFACPQPIEPPPIEAEITTIDLANQTPLAVAGDLDSGRGIFDLSIVFPVGAPAGAMSYTSVVAGDDLHTRIAVSTDKGASWTFLADANQVEPITIDSSDAAFCPGGTCSGNLVHEVSNLVIDPADPDPNRRFKLFVHSYVFTNNTRRVDYGFIGMFTAPDPAGPWSTETKLIGWPSESSFSSLDALQLTTNTAGLEGCFVLTEPGAIVSADGVIHLSLGCVSAGPGFPIKIVLLQSIDHGNRFSFVNDLMVEEDSLQLGFPDPRIQAPYLFTQEGKTFLSATPETAAGVYLECMIVEVTDLNAGEIARDGDGLPVALRHLRSNPASFTGACAYAEGATAAGYVVPVALPENGEVFFRMFSTGVQAP